MRIFIATIVGLVGGFVLGIALSSFIGIIGMLVFQEPMGIKYLSYFTAIICAVVVPIMDRKSREVR
ncbi:DUF5957 family protein [Virgibacillus flavescens]|uniref:DUF5957 family protein n=1 Tax=Virgibacillus flavescens TaxID=1611422 RepID=UPI003D34C471